MSGEQKMKPKLCPICKEYLNETDGEEWCSHCDYSIYIKQPKFWGESE
jgi:uncharacterized Zn finger protein (UPF0148 family)